MKDHPDKEATWISPPIPDQESANDPILQAAIKDVCDHLKEDLIYIHVLCASGLGRVNSLGEFDLIKYDLQPRDSVQIGLGCAAPRFKHTGPSYERIYPFKMHREKDGIASEANEEYDKVGLIEFLVNYKPGEANRCEFSVDQSIRPYGEKFCVEITVTLLSFNLDWFDWKFVVK
jgi:hypothetical protein